MGKGSNRRPTNEKKFCEHHEETYGTRKPRSPGKTTYVYKDGQCVEKDSQPEYFIGIDPAKGSDVTVVSQLSVFRKQLMGTMAVPRDVLGA